MAKATYQELVMNIDQEMGVIEWKDWEFIKSCRHILASTSGIHKIERKGRSEDYYLVPESFYRKCCKSMQSWRGTDLPGKQYNKNGARGT